MLEPSIDQLLNNAKSDPCADLCGMYLTHCGVVRKTAKAFARNHIEMPLVEGINFSYNHAMLEEAIQQTKKLDGIHYVYVWLNEGYLHVGETLMIVIIGADIRPNCIAGLEFLVGNIKDNIVVEDEIFVS